MTVSANTPDRLVLDAGTVTIGGTDVGGTLGGSVFRVEREWVHTQPDGVRGDMKEGSWVRREVPYLEVTCLEQTMVNIQAALAGSSLASNSSSEVITSTPGHVASSAYNDIVWTGAKADGNALEITVSDALADGNLEMGFNDEGQTTYTITFKGYYDPSTPTTAPYTIDNTI